MSIHKSAHERDFLILDNAILRSPKLSLKAKALLAFCLSLPEDWVFSIQGLAYYTKEGVDSVRATVKELEAAGYIQRRRRRADGRYAGMEYEIYESPQLENPVEDKTPLPSINIPSTNLHNMDDTQNLSTYDGLVEAIRKQIEYAIMQERYDSRLLDDLVAVMVDAAMQSGDTISLGRGKCYPAEYVRQCLGKIGPMHIDQILESLIVNAPIIHNTRAYLLTALINAANTMDIGYAFGDY